MTALCQILSQNFSILETKKSSTHVSKIHVEEYKTNKQNLVNILLEEIVTDTPIHYF